MKPILELSKTHEIKKLLRSLRLHTVCEESRCPNIGECFGSGTATFMIMGDTCTRACSFCNLQRGKPLPPDPEEPYKLLHAVKTLKLSYVVLTSPTRDDLSDGGASYFAKCVRVLKENIVGIKVEVLVPDFKGDTQALSKVLSSEPDVLAHNVETVPRLYDPVRAGSKYERSLSLLRFSKELAPHILTKSALVLGFGESLEEIIQVMKDLRAVGCDLLTIGQYYQPSKEHHPVVKYYTEEEFKTLEELAYSLGFKKVASGPNVRSSYKAIELSLFL
ncbi:lipoyl synthase [Hydrogenobacter sp. T-2]|uniref:lipoyl synthase n=1 Tax=Pampinifervens diazotrophicum TaxID=1632018 RepID=UPI002B25E48D|nr:lipoyl synthase [Hydrogenobacter sp. T-2]WPM31653.1 lipoyl synthase [Hydrogenobacter sp. T-2]